MNELSEMLLQKENQAAETYYEKYGPQMEALEKHSPLARLRNVNASDIVNVGLQLDQFQQYMHFMKEAGTITDLGILPRVALDIITTTYGMSIIPVLCSVQPIEEEQGTIYYKATKATATRGNVTADDILRQAVGVPDTYARGYAGEKISHQLGTTTDDLQQYTGNVDDPLTPTNTVPVRPRSVRFDFYTDPNEGTPLANGPWYCTDDGEGNLLGVRCWGTIDYSDGAYVINTEDPDSSDAIIWVEYATDFENIEGLIPQINMTTLSTDIRAEIFVLGSEIGIFKIYAMKKRFGLVAEEEGAEGERPAEPLGRLHAPDHHRPLARCLPRYQVERRAPGGGARPSLL